ncbi:hypothetical protein PENTCL1PPCAC_5032, partial [Pristionchus entomophagus]
FFDFEHYDTFQRHSQYCSTTVMLITMSVYIFIICYLKALLQSTAHRTIPHGVLSTTVSLLILC